MAFVKLPHGTAIVRVAMLAVAIVAGGLTIRSGLAFMLANGSGAAIAARIDPTNTTALSVEANERLKDVQLGKDAKKLAEDSRRILELSPYEVIALRTIGFVADSEDDKDRAEKLMALAARLSLRDYLTHAWLFEHRFSANNVVGAVNEADILLRQDEANWPVILPALVTITQYPRVIEPLAKVLATKPMWRSAYLIALGGTNPSPDATFALFSRLKALGAPANKGELDPYFLKSGQRLTPSQLFAQWVALLPPSAKSGATGLVREGDFTGLDASPPFGWRLFPADNVYAERTGSAPGGMGTALYVAYSGAAQTQFASQQLVLAPGRYRLTGRSYADDAIDKDTFRWSVTCVSKGAQSSLGMIPVDPQPAHLVRFAGEFDVPAGCDQQEISLSGVIRETTFDMIGIYVDGIELTPVR